MFPLSFKRVPASAPRSRLGKPATADRATAPTVTFCKAERRDRFRFMEPRVYSRRLAQQRFFRVSWHVDTQGAVRQDRTTMSERENQASLNPNGEARRRMKSPAGHL